MQTATAYFTIAMYCRLDKSRCSLKWIFHYMTFFCYLISLIKDLLSELVWRQIWIWLFKIHYWVKGELKLFLNKTINDLNDSLLSWFISSLHLVKSLIRDIILQSHILRSICQKPNGKVLKVTQLTISLKLKEENVEYAL